MFRAPVAAFAALALAACVPPATAGPDTAPAADVREEYVVIVTNPLRQPVQVMYAPGNGAPYLLDLVGPSQRKTIPMPTGNGLGGRVYAESTDGQRTSVDVKIERVRVPRRS